MAQTLTGVEIVLQYLFRVIDRHLMTERWVFFDIPRMPKFRPRDARSTSLGIYDILENHCSAHITRTFSPPTLDLRRPLHGGREKHQSIRICDSLNVTQQEATIGT